MLEKWLLVLIIVGCTSIIFLICFPIDFYLYRRRKRLARERTKSWTFPPQPAKRAGQMHSTVSIEASVNDCEDSEQTEKAPYINPNEQEQSKFVRLVNLFRKQKTAKLFQTKDVSFSSSETRSDIPAPRVTKASVQKFDNAHIVSHGGKHCTADNDTELVNNAENTSTNTEQERQNSNESVGINEDLDDSERLLDIRRTHKNYRTKRKSHESLNRYVSVKSNQGHHIYIEHAEYAESRDYQMQVDIDEGVTDVDDIDSDKQYLKDVDQTTLSTVETIEVPFDSSKADFNISDFDYSSHNKASSDKNLNRLQDNDAESLNKTFRKLKSDPVLNLKHDEAEKPLEFEPLTISYSELKLVDDTSARRLHVMYGRRHSNSIGPLDDIVDIKVKGNSELLRTKKSKPLSESDDVGINRKRQKKRKKKKLLQKNTTISMPELSPTAPHIREVPDVFI